MSPSEASDALPERILGALRERSSQKAIDIAKALDLDRHVVNSHLYRLKGKGAVAKDDQHRWSLPGARTARNFPQPRPAPERTEVTKPEKPTTRESGKTAIPKPSDSRTGYSAGTARFGPNLPPSAGLEPKIQRPEMRKSISLPPEHAGTRQRVEPNDPMRPPNVFKRIEPIGVRGRPPKYVRTTMNHKPLALNLAMPRAARYAVALAALVEEMKRQGQGNKRIALENGRPVEIDRGHFGYVFDFVQDAELFEDAGIELLIGGRRIEGEIVSIASGKIIISTEESLGEFVKDCVLLIDNTALLTALRERLEDIGKDGPELNLSIAEDAVLNTGPSRPHASAPPIAKFLDLNSKQQNAVCVALANSVSYLWGPPGTGKTELLSVVVQSLLESGKRVLVCSNTNRAVDQVLFNICRTLTRNHEAMEQGRILRLGRIAHKDLVEFEEFVTLSGIVARKSRDLTVRKELLDDEILRNALRTERVEQILTRFMDLDQLLKTYDSASQIALEARAEFAKSAKSRDEAESRISDLRDESDKRREAGVLRRVFLRSEEAIDKDSEEAREALSKLAAELERARLGSLDSDEEVQRIQHLVSKMKDGLADYDRSTLMRERDQLGERRQTVLDELGKINKALSEIEASVIKEASVIGATVTTSYLRSASLPRFDTVIIDESSMVLLPAAYYASGLASERVIVSGDFRQLPPIIQTEQEAIISEIGGSIFDSAKIVHIVDEGRSHPRLLMLDEQYRMDEEICRLISQPMYQGKLRTTTKHRPSTGLRAREFLSDTLTIVDTSALWPFETQTVFGSRYNLIHALVVRDICLELEKAGFIDKRKEPKVGICTPYSAQAKLLSRLIQDADLRDQIEVGTVHRYQGGQKVMMILDIPESVGGGQYAGRFLQGDNPNDDGAKLFNVAVSRAQEHLVFVANLTHLDRVLPGTAILRDMLFQSQTRGRVLDARELLKLTPADLQGVERTLHLDPDVFKSSLLKEPEFEALFMHDVSHAKKSVVIFSGFITPERVARYGGLFRSKIMDGLSIRCVTRPPHSNGSIPPELGKEALDYLEGIGVMLDCRKDTHEKAVVVDGEIAWIGSLNPLSYSSRTDEIMVRVFSPEFAKEVIRQTAIRPGAVGKSEDDIGPSKENPRCGACDGRTFYVKSKKDGKRYFVCESQDGWIQSVEKNAIPALGTPGPAEKSDQLCPECGAACVVRHGRWGPFVACSRYPKCKGKPEGHGTRTTRDEANRDLLI